MDNKLISARLEEINEGLCGQIGGLTESHYRISKRFGAAVRIANLIKGQDVILDYNYLLAAAGRRCSSWGILMGSDCSLLLAIRMTSCSSSISLGVRALTAWYQYEASI